MTVAVYIPGIVGEVWGLSRLALWGKLCRRVLAPECAPFLARRSDHSQIAKPFMPIDPSPGGAPPSAAAPSDGDATLAAPERPTGIVERLLASPEARSELRRRVEETMQSVRAIAHDLGLPHASLARHIERQGWTRPDGAPVSFGGSPKGRRKLARDFDDAGAVAARLLRVVDRQIARVEGRLKRKNAEIEEKDARILGTLARTLATLMALGEAGAGAEATEHADPDLLRAELARRIERWAGGGEEPSGISGEPAP